MEKNKVYDSDRAICFSSQVIPEATYHRGCFVLHQK